MVKQAPVCHIPPAMPNTVPTVKNLPAVPPATDLKSAIQAVNAIRQIVQIITNQQIQQPYTNNFIADWEESDRVTEVVRVYNPNDKSQYVDIQRINKLTMKDKKTGSKWTFNR